MNPIEQQFFSDLEKKLWTAADKLRSNLDAAVYKHVVLGLIFLKYVSDAFEERQKELREQFQNPGHDYYMAPEDYADDYAGHLAAELEVRDCYLKRNTHGAVFDTITQATIETVTCVRPLNEQLEAFEQQVQPLLGEIRAEVIQNQTLADLRDTLIPKLLSGDLSVEPLLAEAAV